MYGKGFESLVISEAVIGTFLLFWLHVKDKMQLLYWRPHSGKKSPQLWNIMDDDRPRSNVADSITKTRLVEG
jgi:hypothetical protein